MNGFPDFIEALPRPDSPVPMDAYIVPNPYCLPMFFEVTGTVEIPEHVHGAQWGVVLEGSVEMTIGGEEYTYQKGDTYYVPPGVPHIAVIHGPCRGIDVFEDNDRYLPMEDEG